MVDAGPNWTDIVTAVATSTATVVLFGTAWFAYRQLKGAASTRDGALLTDLSRRWDEPVLVRAQELFAYYTTGGIVELIEKVYSEEGADENARLEFTTLEALPNLWETLGVMKAEEMVSLSVIDRMWGRAITTAWDAWEEPILRLREITGEPTTYAYFESLAAELREFDRDERLRARLAAILRMRKGRTPKALRIRLHLRSFLRHLRR